MVQVSCTRQETSGSGRAGRRGFGDPPALLQAPASAFPPTSRRLTAAGTASVLGPERMTTEAQGRAAIHSVPSSRF